MNLKTENDLILEVLDRPFRFSGDIELEEMTRSEIQQYRFHQQPELRNSPEPHLYKYSLGRLYLMVAPPVLPD
jgi:hypothetical protein